MNIGLILLAVAGLGALAALGMGRQRPGQGETRDNPIPDTGGRDLFDLIDLPYLSEDAGSVGGSAWQPPERAEPYLSTIRDAERVNSLPENLLARVLYQESRYRDDIIRGDLTSSAGAVGIAQIVPKWHPGVDPTDPIASIYYAAEYLRQLYQQFGNWKDALAAYNWGPGNLSRYGRDRAPTETQQYVAQITADVPVA